MSVIVEAKLPRPLDTGLGLAFAPEEQYVYRRWHVPRLALQRSAMSVEYQKWHIGSSRGTMFIDERHVAFV